jgi:hypothetical protein
MSSNGYPFLSRRQIRERIASEPAFVVQCFAILKERYERRAALTGESAGWMASHASRATTLAMKLVVGNATEKERAEAALLVAHYSKQLARVLRDREIAARPEVMAHAAVFGVAPVRVVVAPAIEAAAPVEPLEAPRAAPVSHAEPPSEPPPPPKKRGRPVGSRNRPKDQPAAMRKRRSRT